MEFTIGNLNPSKAKEAVTETSFHDTRRPYFFLLNPLVPEGTNIDRITNLKKEGVKEKNSYDRRVYESVDDESLS